MAPKSRTGERLNSLPSREISATLAPKPRTNFRPKLVWGLSDKIPVFKCCKEAAKSRTIVENKEPLVRDLNAARHQGYFVRRSAGQAMHFSGNDRLLRSNE